MRCRHGQRRAAFVSFAGCSAAAACCLTTLRAGSFSRLFSESKVEAVAFAGAANGHGNAAVHGDFVSSQSKRLRLLNEHFSLALLLLNDVSGNHADGHTDECVSDKYKECGEETTAFGNGFDVPKAWSGEYGEREKKRGWESGVG